MKIKVSATKPTKDPIPPRSTIERELQRILKQAIIEFQREIQRYPPYKPWKNPPKTGPRAGGKRLGNYGRGWGANAKITPQGMEAIVIQNLVEYARYVGGPDQPGFMAARGWPLATKVASDVVKRMASQGKIKFKF